MSHNRHNHHDNSLLLATLLPIMMFGNSSTRTSKQQTSTGTIANQDLNKMFTGPTVFYSIVGEKTLLVANINIGYGNALFISGEHPMLGQWQNAIRMICINSSTWKLEITNNLEKSEFKFLMGTYSAGINVPTCNLTWEPGDNRVIRAEHENKSCCKIL